MSDNIPTSKPSPPPNSKQTASQLTLFAEGSLVRTSPSQGGGRNGRRHTQRIMERVRPSYWRITTPLRHRGERLSTCFGEGLTAYSETWPRSGMMQSGIAYRLPPLVRLTDGTGSGLWRTPQAGDERACHTGTQNQVMLAHQVMWPTPQASPNQNRDTKPKPSAINGTHGWSLAGAVHDSFSTKTAPSVAHADNLRELQPQGRKQNQRGWLGNSSWWDVEPNVGRVANGVPARVDRLKSLGNAVVPQIPELIGRAILSAEAASPQEE
jgi:hypothetical protein